jgi:hypothetical protein
MTFLEHLKNDLKARSKILLFYVCINLAIAFGALYMLVPVNVVDVESFQTFETQYSNGSKIAYEFTFNKYFDFNINLNKSMQCGSIQVQVLDSGFVESNSGDGVKVLSSVQMINDLPSGTVCTLDFSFYFELPFGKRADQTHIQSNEFTII